MYVMLKYMFISEPRSCELGLKTSGISAIGNEPCDCRCDKLIINKLFLILIHWF